VSGSVGQRASAHVNLAPLRPVGITRNTINCLIRTMLAGHHLGGRARPVAGV